MDDIEDLVRESSEVADVKERQELNDELVLPKRSRSKKPKQKAVGYDIPGTQTGILKRTRRSFIANLISVCKNFWLFAQR